MQPKHRSDWAPDLTGPFLRPRHRSSGSLCVRPGYSGWRWPSVRRTDLDPNSPKLAGHGPGVDSEHGGNRFRRLALSMPGGGMPHNAVGHLARVRARQQGKGRRDPRRHGPSASTGSGRNASLRRLALLYTSRFPNLKWSAGASASCSGEHRSSLWWCSNEERRPSRKWIKTR